MVISRQDAKSAKKEMNSKADYLLNVFDLPWRAWRLGG